MKFKGLIFLMILVGIFLLGCTSTAKSPSGNVVKEVGDDYVRIPVSEISSELKKYSFDANGVNVNYFLVKGSDGKIRSAFDACDVCGGYMGYKQRGNDVVCNKCGKVFRIADIGTKNRGGGCWPSYLSNKIEQLILVEEAAEVNPPVADEIN